MKYDIIYADPPWKYGSRGVRSGMYGKLDYSAMTTEEICALPVAGIAKDNCALFMWVTGSFMPDALQVGHAWGFSHVRIDTVWAKKKLSGKPHGVVGPWGMSDAEFIVLFVKGSMCSNQVGKRNQYVITAEEYPGTHSEKPKIFRDRIRSRFPESYDRIELFSRETNEGWHVWGNEVQSDISIGLRVRRKTT